MWRRGTVALALVRTAGPAAAQWLSLPGPGIHPHTDALHITERFRRTSVGAMENVATIDDPKADSRPWTAQTMRLALQPDTELLEHLCENNRDLERLQKIWQGR